MQQMALSSTYSSLLVFARAYPPVAPAGESEAPGLGRRLPRLERTSRPAEPTANGLTFLDHLRHFAS